jgi:hypothetical protein
MGTVGIALPRSIERCRDERRDGDRIVAGDLFHIPPVPHDSWVIGDETYVSLHFLGAERYTK